MRLMEFLEVGKVSNREEEQIQCWCGAVGTFNEMFDDDVYSKTCGGSRWLHCKCGGDFCVCHHHGEVECGGCEDCDVDDGDYDEDYDI